MNPDPHWGADVPISMPQPIKSNNKRYLELGPGFAFTENGLAHDLYEVDREEMFAPYWQPNTDPRHG